MKIKTVDYIANQTTWLEKLQTEKDMRLVAEAKLRESEIEAVREAVKVYNRESDQWKAGHNEWKQSTQSILSNTITRREAWIFTIAMGTFMLMIIAIGVSIWDKMK